jgi:hypothetical protein
MNREARMNRPIRTLLLGLLALGSQAPAAAPLYWSAYEYCKLADSYIPEKAWSDNVDWVEKNLKPYGYDTVAIDGWGDDMQYTANGYRTTHSKEWQHDYAWWSRELQKRGMKLGMYNTPLWVNRQAAADGLLVKGTQIPLADIIDTSEPGLFTWVQVKKPGAEQYVKGYIQYYADMGVKFLRIDFLNLFETGMDRRKAVARTGRPREDYVTALRWMKEACDANGMILSLCMSNLTNEGEAERQYTHMYRINEDVGDGKWWRFSDLNRGARFPFWSQFSNAFDGYTYWSRYAGRGKAAMDGDFIRMHTYASDDEKKSVVSLHLLAGGPVAVADQFSSIGGNLKFYQNRELLALNADGFVGQPLSADPGNESSQIWKGQLSNGDWVVGMFNREADSRRRGVDFAKDLGLSGTAQVRDLWLHKDLGAMADYKAWLKPRQCTVLRIRHGR